MLKRLLFYVLNFYILIILSMFPFMESANQSIAMSGNICPFNVFEKIKQIIIPSAKVEEGLESAERLKVYVSGRPIGFSIDGAGVVVVTMGEIKTSEGYVNSPCLDAGIQSGDIIKKVDGIDITSGERLIDVVNSRNGGLCNIEFVRDGESRVVGVQPVFDEFALSYRLGVWVRDNAVGVGTVTYVTQDDSFSALGHPITDLDTSTIFPVGDGSVYKCSIIGVKKGVKGEPGELKGLFLKTSNEVGMVLSNTTAGVRGRFVSGEASAMFKDSELAEVALRKEVKAGDASIYTTIDGSEPKHYKIEIIKTNHINAYGNKCMVIRITDEELLARTNGIVQGMSGSPIIQNGKLVGCVTHVFINDPAKGFADFIDLN